MIQKHNTTCRRAVYLLLVAMLCSSPAAAQYGHHDHAELSSDQNLTLHDVVEAALNAYPERQVLETRQNQADAWVDRGRSWLLDRPSLMMRYQSDRFGSDNGLDEYEAGVELPLWSWGGRSAVQALGQALTSESKVAGMALRWEVGGIVREALWDVALAENARDLAVQSETTAIELFKAVERRHELGDVAYGDVLLAQTSYFEYQTMRIEADAALLDAARSYSLFTGLERRPSFVAESMSDIEEITLNHPALALADSAALSAEANVTVAQTTSEGATVLIGARRERAAFSTMSDESIGLTVNVPFGGNAHRKTTITEAARKAAEAQATLDQEIRMLTLAMHEATHGLAVVQQKLITTNKRHEVAKLHEKMGETAYEEGEIDLIDLVKIKAIALAAEREAAQLQIEKKRQIARYNQAVGELP